MRTCEHIKSNGEFCGSPPLRGRPYCYFHLTLAGSRLRNIKHLEKFEFYPLELPVLEDGNSIQLAIMQVMDALIHGRISTRISGKLLYGLQLASANLWQGANFKQEKGATVCGCYDSFEQDYGLADTDCKLKVPEKDDEGAAASEQNIRRDGLSQSSQFHRQTQKSTKFFEDTREILAVGE